jgi:uncharacterized protein (DUF58 family)
MLSFLKRTGGIGPQTLRTRHSDRNVMGARARSQSASHVSPELLQQVKLIELKTRSIVNTLFTGEYRSVFKGQGMEFSEVREYQPGDEIRSIDWNVTARTGRPYVKRYIEERELTVMLAMDLSGSERFGTVRRFKSELVIEFATLIAMSAVRNNDRVGVIFFTDRVEYVVPPRKGKRHAMRLVRDFLAFEPKGTQTDFAPALQHLNRTLHHHSIIFLVSDFMTQGFERPLSILTQRHDVVAVSVTDPSEQVLPDVGVARLLDPETNAYIEVDTSDKVVRSAYTAHVDSERQARKKLLGRLGVDEIPLLTAQTSVEPLLKFFRNRENRRRR